MKIKKLLSLVTALSLLMSTFVCVHQASAAQVTEDILTWAEVKEYISSKTQDELKFKTSSGGSADGTEIYYYKNYGEKPTYAEAEDYLLLTNSSYNGSNSAGHYFNVPSEKQISSGNVHLEYEINIPSMTSDETPVKNAFSAWGTLIGQNFDSGKIFDYYKGTDTTPYFNIEKRDMKSGTVSPIKPTTVTDTWFKITVDVDYTERTAVLNVYDSASGTQIGSTQSFALKDDATYLKDIYMSFTGAEVKIRNINASVVNTVKTAVTGCNVEDGDKNVDTSSIILTFNEDIEKADLDTLTVTDTDGNTYSTYKAVNGNKAQVSIIAAKKKTGYTLSIPQGDNIDAYSVSFESGTLLYSYKWSSIGGNTDRLNVTNNYGGSASENLDEGYIKLLKKNIWDYSLETCSYSDDTVVVEYDQYIPTYYNGDETKPVDTARYNTYQCLYLDNGAYIQFDLWNTPLFTELGEWHRVIWTYNFSSNSYSLTIDDTTVTPSKSGTHDGATYVKSIQFRAAGNSDASWNKESHIKNISSRRKTVTGTWSKIWSSGTSTVSTDVEDIVTITDNNDGTSGGKNIWSYELSESVTDGMVKISYDFMANQNLVTSSKPEVRFGGVAKSSGNAIATVSWPYQKPEIRWTNGFAFNKPETTDLEAGVWHTAEYVFDVDATDGVTLKYVTVDDEITLANYTSTQTALQSVQFWSYYDDSIEGAFELKLKNINVEKNYVGDDIVISANIENEAEEVCPREIVLYFSAPVEESITDNIYIYDEDGEIVSDYTVTLNEINTKAYVVMNNYDLGAMYSIVIDKNDVNGYLGGSMAADYELIFFAETSATLSGNWNNSWNNADIESSISTEDGITTINVQNTGVDGTQATREAYSYSLDAPIMGNNIPVTISYKFMANEALTESAGSNVRFYPVASAAGGTSGTPFAVDFPFTTPQFRWDNIVFNLPTDVESLVPNAWHEIKFVYNVDATDGTTLDYVELDGVKTFTNYTKTAATQLQSVDFWFYGEDGTQGDFELKIKDMKIKKGEETQRDFKIVSATKTVNEETVDIKVTFENTTPATVTGQLIAAAYDIDGALLEVGFKDLSVDADIPDAEDTVSFTKPSKDIDSIRVFVWDSLIDITSLCEAYPVE